MNNNDNLNRPSEAGKVSGARAVGTSQRCGNPAAYSLSESAECRIRVSAPPYGIENSPIFGLCGSNAFQFIPGGTFVVDWGSCGFASVSQICAVASTALRAKEIGCFCSSIPSDTIDGYVSRVDFYRVLEIDHREKFIRHSENDRFMPIKKLSDSDVNEIATQLRTTVTSHLSFADSVIDMIDYSFGEILDNVLMHSKAPGTGLACSQFLPNGNYVEVCVSDCGVGIAETMAKNKLYADKDMVELMALAFDKGTGEYVGKDQFSDDRTSGGMGLRIASNVATALGGHIWAVSRKQSIHISKQGIRSFGSGRYFPGTVISMRFPVTDMKLTGDDVLDDGSSKTVRWNTHDSWNYEGSDEDDVLW